MLLYVYTDYLQFALRTWLISVPINIKLKPKVCRPNCSESRELFTAEFQASKVESLDET